MDIVKCFRTYAQKDKTKNYVTRHGSPITMKPRGSISEEEIHKCPHFDLAAQKKQVKVPGRRIYSRQKAYEVFENLPISNVKDYLTRFSKQAE